MVTTDTQVKGLFKRMSEGKPLYVAAQQSGMCEKTARKYYRCNRFPSAMRPEHDWCTRTDPFSKVWEEVEALLAKEQRLEAKTAFAWLQGKYPGEFDDGQLRTLQRRFHEWRALHGDAKETFFPQDHHPGDLGASDFTWMTDLDITIAGSPFDHMLYHYVLTWSNWEHGTVCFSESYESLSTGLQNAWWRCGGVPSKHRTDRLSAAVNNLDEKRDLTVRCAALLRHYDVAGQKTNPNSGNENGDVEQRHHRIKRAVEQALILRGSHEFSARQEYELFLEHLFDRLNAGREERFAEERRCLHPLPARRLPDYTELRGVSVGKSSTITVRKKVYSVHSRLRDEHVTVNLYAEYLDVFLGSTKVERIPRARGAQAHRINYRHIIDWLVRKPGAFANYRYHSDLFPTSQFRIAYDMLKTSCPTRAAKEYLHILYTAAYGSEELVSKALERMIAEGKTPTAVEVDALVRWMQNVNVTTHTDPCVAPVDLVQYDDLLDRREVAL
jgi:hypothetical protein